MLTMYVSRLFRHRPRLRQTRILRRAEEYQVCDAISVLNIPCLWFMDLRARFTPGSLDRSAIDG